MKSILFDFFGHKKTWKGFAVALSILMIFTFVWMTGYHGITDRYENLKIILVNNDTEFDQDTVSNIIDKIPFQVEQYDSLEEANQDLDAREVSMVIEIPSGFYNSVVDNETTDLNFYINQAQSSMGKSVMSSASTGITKVFNESVYNEKQTKIVEAIQEGMNQLSDGSSQIMDGENNLYDGADQIDAGANDLSSGSDQLVEGVAKLMSGSETLSSGAGDLSTGIQTVQSALNTLEDQNGVLTDGSSQIESALQQINEQLSNLSTSTDALAQLVSASNEINQGISKLDSALDPNYANSSIWSALETKNAALTENNQTALETALSGSLAQLNLINPTLATNLGNYIQMESAYRTGVSSYLSQVKSSTDTLVEGYETFNSSISILTNSLTTSMSDLVKLQSAISTLTTKYATLNDGIIQYTEAVSSINTGYASIVDAYAKIYGGLGTVSTGLDSLYNGSSQLSDGSKTLSDGTGSLLSGIGSLKEASSKLDEGLNTLSDKTNEAISTLSVNTINESVISVNQADDFSIGMIALMIVISALMGMVQLLLQIGTVLDMLRNKYGVMKTMLMNLFAGVLFSAILAGFVVAFLKMFDVEFHQDIVVVWGFFFLTYIVDYVFCNMFVEPLGDIGMLLIVLTLSIQLISSGAIIAILLLPNFYQKIGTLLPGKYIADGVLTIVFGGTGISHDFYFLMLIGGVCLGVWILICMIKSLIQKSKSLS